MKDNSIIDKEYQENLNSFFRLFVVFNAVAYDDIYYTERHLVVFCVNFINELKESNIENVFGDEYDLFLKSLNFFDTIKYQNNKYFSVKKQYLPLIEQPETNPDYIMIRENMFKKHYQMYCSQESLHSLVKSISNSNEKLRQALDDIKNNNENNNDSNLVQ